MSSAAAPAVKTGNPVRASNPLARWLLLGELRAHPVRALVAIAAIALGVALGYAVDLINGAAFNEFSAAARSLSGQSDLQLRGVQGTFDEAVYPQLAKRQGVAVASPVLELNVTLPGKAGALKVLGIDTFRAARITPDLIGMADPGRPFDTLADDAIFLSPAAQQWLQVQPGQMLALRNGTASVSLRVAGGLAGARAGQRIAVMDIGAAQWRFGRIGQLSRIDLKLQPGVNREAFRRALQAESPPHLQVSAGQDLESSNNNMSRAYRINLNVLALVALFTGAFLVFSTQALSVIRRRPQLPCCACSDGGAPSCCARYCWKALCWAASGRCLDWRWDMRWRPPPCIFLAATSAAAISAAYRPAYSSTCRRRWFFLRSAAASPCSAAWRRRWKRRGRIQRRRSNPAAKKPRWRRWRHPGRRWPACCWERC